MITYAKLGAFFMEFNHQYSSLKVSIFLTKMQEDREKNGVCKIPFWEMIQYVIYETK